jgi:hypothetical protein
MHACLDARGRAPGLFCAHAYDSFADLAIFTFQFVLWISTTNSKMHHFSRSRFRYSSNRTEIVDGPVARGPASSAVLNY